MDARRADGQLGCGQTGYGPYDEHQHERSDKPLHRQHPSCAWAADMR